MNKTMTLLKDATYKNPIFCKTYYKDNNVLVACVELGECEVENDYGHSTHTCDKAVFIILHSDNDAIKIGSGITWIDDYDEPEWSIEILPTTKELLDKFEGALANRTYTITFYEYPEYPELAEENISEYDLYIKYGNTRPINEFTVQAPDDINTTIELEKWIIENYPEYFYCMCWHNTVGDFHISPCSIGGLLECYAPNQLDTKAHRIQIAKQYYEKHFN